MSPSRPSLVEYLLSALGEQANPDEAAGMEACMKTAMPFHGVQKPGRTKLLRQIRRVYVPASRDEYEELVT